MFDLGVPRSKALSCNHERLFDFWTLAAYHKYSNKNYIKKL